MFYERSCFIFDLDGTLIDSLGVWSQVDQELMRRLSNGRVMLSEDEAGTLRIRAMKTYGEGSDAYFKYMADLKRALICLEPLKKFIFSATASLRNFYAHVCTIAKGRRAHQIPQGTRQEARNRYHNSSAQH